MVWSVRKGKRKMRGRSKNQGCLTIMIFKELGKVRTFKISSRLILWASVFFIFYVVATIFLTNKYFDIYRINRMQADKIAELRRELIKTTKSLKGRGGLTTKGIEPARSNCESGGSR